MNIAPMHEKKIITPYPTNHIFNMPVSKLKSSIIHCFSDREKVNSKEYNSLIFYYNVDLYSNDNNTKMLVYFSTETSNNSLFSKDFFSTEGTDKDIYLHSHGQFWYSPIYYALGKQLEFRAQFRLRLIPLNENQTRLIVDIENPRVIKGIGGIGPHGFYSKEIKVKSTTIEEYSLIWYIASQIGDTTLKPLDLDNNLK
jgi:hypothetical protein